MPESNSVFKTHKIPLLNDLLSSLQHISFFVFSTLTEDVFTDKLYNSVLELLLLLEAL